MNRPFQQWLLAIVSAALIGMGGYIIRGIGEDLKSHLQQGYHEDAGQRLLLLEHRVKNLEHSVKILEIRRDPSAKRGYGNTNGQPYRPTEGE